MNNPRSINGTPFADVPAGYRIIAVDRSEDVLRRFPGIPLIGYRWQRVADGYEGLIYTTHQRAAAGAAADAAHYIAKSA